MCLPFTPKRRILVEGRRRFSANGGAVLLEVILALGLFVAAAAILTSALSSSLDSVERLRLNAHAADLAVTVLSELQLGIKTLGGTAPEAFDKPEDEWTWEAVVAPAQNEAEQTNTFKRVEVTIRHEQPPVTYRLWQVLPLDPTKPENEAGRPGIRAF